MPTGVVSRFNDTNGLGWITPDDGGPPPFVHWSQIQTSGVKVLVEGDKVEFTFGENGAKGPQAQNVTVIR